jgi:phage shock protein PspC (stress-responsive transcriptional regulator)
MTNRSELKKMTAHDYEDLLQVSGVCTGFEVSLSSNAHLVRYTCF